MQRLLPPILLLVVVALIVALGPVMPIARASWRPAPWLGYALVALGIATAVIARRSFARARTNVHTFREPDVLVTSGLFARSRNPMYLGFAMVALGAALATGAASSLLVAAAFIVVTDRWYIRFEERAMLAKFGPRYVEYKRRVRRWL